MTDEPREDLDKTAMAIECDVPFCALPRRTKGYCSKHYQEVWQWGTVRGPRACAICSTGDIPAARQRSTRYCSLQCRNLYNKFGIDATAYDRLIRCATSCAACGGPGTYGGRTGSSLVVDHCHKSNRIRGLLHKNCNQVLGHVDDNPHRLLDLSRYLACAGRQPDDLPLMPFLPGTCPWCDKPLVLTAGRRPPTYCPQGCAQYAHKTWTRFRLRPGQVRYLLSDQQGLCAACHEPLSSGAHRRQYSIDHSHLTGLIRGVVHDACNCALGLVDDDPDRLILLAQYVTAHA